MAAATLLSEATARMIDWDKIYLAADEMGPQMSLDRKESVQRPADPARVREVFEVAKREFREAMQPLRSAMRIAIPLMVVAFAATVAAGFIFPLLPWAGIVSGGVGVTGTLVAGGKVWRLSRDQVMLELIPTSYQVALELCATPEQYAKFLDRFLNDVTKVRPQAVRR